MMNNMVGWFEIPVLDMERAKIFYETVFNIKIHIEDFKVLKMGWFPWEEGKPGAAGSLVFHKEWYKPSERYGPLLYFSSDDVQNEIAKIESSGGKIIQPKTLIKEDIGYMAVFLDTEGNRIALHSRK